MVESLDGVGVCVCIAAPPLEEFPTDEAGVDVHVGEGDAADFFEVKIKVGAVDGVEVRAFGAGGDGGGCVVCVYVSE